MEYDRFRHLIFFILTLIALNYTYLLPALSEEKRVSPNSHHFELTEKPLCTECHLSDDSADLKPISSLSHSSDFISSHRFYAMQGSQLCSVCHSPSFCSDCHTNKSGLKPSDRYQGAPERWLPHRGNYLFQHRIDGSIDPASCFRCHGRRNNKLCLKCHQ